MKKYGFILFAAFLITGFSGCVKEKVAAPNTPNTDPDITVNFSLDSVVGRYTGQPYQFTQNLTISAVVVGDDKSGNLYKELAIEDSTGGILLMLNGNYLYTNYPVGRRLFINLKNLWVVQYDGAYELVEYVNTDGTFGGIAPPLFSTFITPGKWGVVVPPIDVPITQLNNSLQGELIELDGVQFNDLTTGETYANDSSLASTTLTLSDCSHNTVSVYNSGYANFANTVVPTGNGKLLAIYSVYDGAGQLMIRDTTDVNFKGTRCP